MFSLLPLNWFDYCTLFAAMSPMESIIESDTFKSLFCKFVAYMFSSLRLLIILSLIFCRPLILWSNVDYIFQLVETPFQSKKRKNEYNPSLILEMRVTEQSIRSYGRENAWLWMAHAFLCLIHNGKVRRWVKWDVLYQLRPRLWCMRLQGIFCALPFSPAWQLLISNRHDLRVTYLFCD